MKYLFFMLFFAFLLYGCNKDDSVNPTSSANNENWHVILQRDTIKVGVTVYWWYERLNFNFSDKAKITFDYSTIDDSCYLWVSLTDDYRTYYGILNRLFLPKGSGSMSVTCDSIPARYRTDINYFISGNFHNPGNIVILKNFKLYVNKHINY